MSPVCGQRGKPQISRGGRSRPAIPGDQITDDDGLVVYGRTYAESKFPPGELLRLERENGE